MAKTEFAPDRSQNFSKHLLSVAVLLEENQPEAADEALEQLDPSTRLLVLSRLDAPLRRRLIESIDPEDAAEYLHDIPEIQALRLLEKITPSKAAEILEELPKDEQADFVGEMSEAKQASILSQMPAQDADEVRELIAYEDEEAGGIMIVDYVWVHEKQTVGDVVDHLQANADKFSDFDVQYVYVVGEDRDLRGVLRLRDLVLSPRSAKIGGLMISDPLAVNDHMPLRDLHHFFVEHNYVGVPVVDSVGKMVGVLRRGDVEEAMSDHYAEDYLKTQGIVNEELRTMPLALRSRRRLAWLSINVLLNIVAASVIAFYQDTLSQVIALAVFLPIISDMSGCSGNQAVAVSMRELSLGLVNPKEVLRVWMKEVSVGLINGFALGVLIAMVAFIWQGNPWLGVVVGLAMMINTIVAVSLGGTLPLVMRQFKLDPALASGPILTTVTDMCGFFLVLSCASLLIDKLI
jgi:magnesium transporter